MVYPFYCKVNSNSRKTEVGVGAKGKKNADMTVQILQRDRGEITCPFTIRQFTSSTLDGEVLLVTQVYDRFGCLVASNETLY